MILPFCDKLAESKSSRHNRVLFIPSETTAAAGLLAIVTGRAVTEYALAEFDTDWPGLALHLAKITPGTDREAESYSVFCHAGDPARDTCDCRGFERWRTCKHVNAIRAVIANGWI